MRRVHRVALRLMLAAVVCGAFLIGNSLAQQKEGPAAADTRLALVPEDAYGFAVIRNLAELDKKIANVAQAVQVPAPRR